MAPNRWLIYRTFVAFIALYKERLPVIEQALNNINQLQQQSDDQLLSQSLKSTAETWKKQQAFMLSELQAAQLQFDKLVASETSITEASQSYLKSFFISVRYVRASVFC